MKKILMNFGILLFVLMPFANCNAEIAVKKEFTENKEKEWHEKQLNENIVKIEYDNDSVHFVSTGRFGLYIESPTFTGQRDWIIDFHLKIKDNFYHQPDHHALMDYELFNFNENFLTLKYTSSFDHRSFGKNLITIDTGIINLKYKKSITNQSTRPD